MEFFILLSKTVLLRPYVFLFLAAFLFTGRLLLGWRRTGALFLITWITAFACEFSSTRTGIPFGWYFYTGSTRGEELYLTNIPFMDSLSFTFLLFASYCLALVLLLPARLPPRTTMRWPDLVCDPRVRTSWPVLLLAVLFFTFIDVVIDPVALRGDRWFLGQIYGYPEPGVHFGVPLANYVGWAVVGVLALSAYFVLDRRWSRAPEQPDGPSPHPCAAGGGSATGPLLLGCGLYYAVLAFNLSVTFWIGEPLLGTTGLLIYLPITAFLLLRLFGHLPMRGGSA